MDLDVVLGMAGTLIGVGLGGMLGARSQRRLLQDSHALTQRAARESIYVEYLSAYRQFRRFVMTEPVHIQLVPRAGHPDVPVIPGSHPYWEAVEAARARLDIVAGHKPIWAVGERLADCLSDIARAQATHPPGQIPDTTIAKALDAEREFAQAARTDLDLNEQRAALPK
jgi:hypothetical protein